MKDGMVSNYSKCYFDVKKGQEIKIFWLGCNKDNEETVKIEEDKRIELVDLVDKYIEEKQSNSIGFELITDKGAEHIIAFVFGEILRANEDLLKGITEEKEQ